jgi:tyrosinase
MALTRRTFVAGTAAIPFALFYDKYAWAQGTRIRYDATSTQGKAMLKIYAGAVAKMRAAPFTDGNPRSWTFQWYTHQVKGQISQAAQNKANALAAIYPGGNPPTWRALAAEMWNTCQAHLGQPEINFLPWHRMYVYYFESIVRAVSGHDEFTLPYWNYSVPKTNPAHGVLPVEFRMPNDPLFKSLYVDKRNALANSGQAIDKNSADDPLSLVSLKECTYLPAAGKQGFNLALDSGLHGNVHVLTGNGQNMGSVPWAAYDPIFWMHHCNIDRLWASWNAGGRTNASFGTQKFVFANNAGNRVERLAQDFTSIAPLGYRYDHLEPVPACPTTHLTAATAGLKLVTKASPIPLGPGPVRVTLAATPGPAASVPLKTRVEHLPAGHRLYLHLRNLSTEGQPEVLFHLYLQLPSGSGGTTDFYVGHINFFEHERHGEGHGSNGDTDKFYSFDITDLAKRLQASGKLTSNPELTIVPEGQPAAAARPVIGEVSIVEQ